LDGWEIRPFAVEIATGIFAPRLSARKHCAGSKAAREFCFDTRCTNKEEAFQVALRNVRSVLTEELLSVA